MLAKNDQSQKRAEQVGLLAVCGLVVASAGWVIVVVVLSQRWSDSLDLLWLPVGLMISAIGISHFLLAASTGRARSVGGDLRSRPGGQHPWADLRSGRSLRWR